MFGVWGLCGVEGSDSIELGNPGCLVVLGVSSLFEVEGFDSIEVEKWLPNTRNPPPHQSLVHERSDLIDYLTMR